MAKVVPAEYVSEIHGKLSGKSSGYFYGARECFARAAVNVRTGGN